MTTAPLEQHRSTLPRQATPATRADAVVIDIRDGVDARDLRVVAGQRRRLDVQARQLGRLMERRPELRGAYAPADLALEALITGI